MSLPYCPSQGESICREALATATAQKSLDDLNLNLQKASEMGLTGPEVDRAKALQKELHISHASLKALRWVFLSSSCRIPIAQ